MFLEISETTDIKNNFDILVFVAGILRRFFYPAGLVKMVFPVLRYLDNTNSVTSLEFNHSAPSLHLSVEISLRSIQYS
jgi:hypothetical protein